MSRNQKKKINKIKKENEQLSAMIQALTGDPKDKDKEETVEPRLIRDQTHDYRERAYECAGTSR